MKIVDLNEIQSDIKDIYSLKFINYNWKIHKIIGLSQLCKRVDIENISFDNDSISKKSNKCLRLNMGVFTCGYLTISEFDSLTVKSPITTNFLSLKEVINFDTNSIQYLSLKGLEVSIFNKTINQNQSWINKIKPSELAATLPFSEQELKYGERDFFKGIRGRFDESKIDSQSLNLCINWVLPDMLKGHNIDDVQIEIEGYKVTCITTTFIDTNELPKRTKVYIRNMFGSFDSSILASLSLLDSSCIDYLTDNYFAPEYLKPFIGQDVLLDFYISSGYENHPYYRKREKKAFKRIERFIKDNQITFSHISDDRPFNYHPKGFHRCGDELLTKKELKKEHEIYKSDFHSTKYYRQERKKKKKWLRKMGFRKIKDLRIEQ